MLLLPTAWFFAASCEAFCTGHTGNDTSAGSRRVGSSSSGGHQRHTGSKSDSGFLVDVLEQHRYLML